jgi:hypothetical protein
MLYECLCACARMIPYHASNHIAPTDAEPKAGSHFPEAADQLHMRSITLELAIEGVDIEAEHPLANGPWVINRRALETGKAVGFAERSRRQRGNSVLEVSDQGLIVFFSDIARWAL